ncbi:MAG TPA: hypothetical protein VNN80_25790, partial [Polyangiaceae bacterium]|nr:hypothetical protein [Polyangiaceae bacterium]
AAAFSAADRAAGDLSADRCELCSTGAATGDFCAGDFSASDFCAGAGAGCFVGDGGDDLCRGRLSGGCRLPASRDSAGGFG